ncbi:MAG: hypothetical protein JXR83_22170 [Deltaproteobacteria bacterium]|nr:hypothetical protein [Deltaproteobacteria bacterium]
MKKIATATMALLVTSSLLATPEYMTRDQIIQYGKWAKGYSYWWGGSRFRDDHTQLGSCSGSCPSCSHCPSSARNGSCNNSLGEYGGDCSGLVCKAWQVPSPVALTTNSHPYSTYHFRNNTTHWSRLSSWGNAKKGDAFVYNYDGHGHIVLYEKGDPWGLPYVYECKGCSPGCVYNQKDITSSYIAIRRVKITEGSTAPSTGKMMGAVYLNKDNDDMSERLPGATVTASGGGSTTAREGDALWSFTLNAGTYTFTAALSGYESASRSCTVVADGEVWCSIGLTPSCTPDCSGRECGADPVCGKSCGTCTGIETCSSSGQCECVADCSGRACGPDPVCGLSCGSCGDGEQCSASGQCECQPQCGDQMCGLDPVCGQSCGECGDGSVCNGTQCVCAPQCGGRVCGLDPVCGQSCGACGEGLLCDGSGRCVDPASCSAQCEGRVCGLDPACGKSCGLCSAELACDAAGQCVAIDPSQGKLYGYVVALAEPGDQAEMKAASKRISQARVMLDDGTSAVADENGYFELLVTPQQWTLIASAAGYADGEATCQATAGAATECYVAVYPALKGTSAPEKAAVGWHSGCAAIEPAPGAFPLGLALLALLRRRR